MSLVRVVCIKPGEIPIPDFVEQDIILLAKSVNIDKNGNPHKEFEPFEISEIKNNVNVISSPKGEERNLPLVRTVGRYIKLYGIVYIVKMDDRNELIDMSLEEAVEYCIKFTPLTISLESLGFAPVTYPEDYEDEYDENDDYEDLQNHKQNNNGTGRISITFDEW